MKQYNIIKTRLQVLGVLSNNNQDIEQLDAVSLSQNI